MTTTVPFTVQYSRPKERLRELSELSLQNKQLQMEGNQRKGQIKEWNTIFNALHNLFFCQVKS